MSTENLIANIPQKEKDSLLIHFFNDLVSIHPQPWRVERDWGYDIIDANGKEVFHCLREPSFADFIIDFSKKFDTQSNKEYDSVLKDATGLNQKEHAIIDALTNGEWKNVEEVVIAVYGGDSYFIKRSFDVYCARLRKLGYDVVFNADKTQVKLKDKK